VTQFIRSQRRCAALSARVRPAGSIALLWLAVSAAGGGFGCGGGKDAARRDIAGDSPAGTARHALLAAEAAASSWMRDAHLIYLENDGPLAEGGQTPRWGFLFRSEMGDSWRVVSVENGRVVHEGPLGYPFAAPDLPAEWIDSSAAVERAEEAGGRRFREQGGLLEHAVLARGVFTPWDGPPTWTVVYRGTDRSELAIVVNAADGTILDRFEG
jgi:hypothetical protein